VIRVEHDGNAIDGSDGSDVESGGFGAGDGCLLFIVGKTFACKVSAAALRNLKDDGRFDVPRSF
jgi:hypothetical protein